MLKVKRKWSKPKIMEFCNLRLMRIKIRETIHIKNVMLLNLMEHWMAVENVLLLKNTLTLKIECVQQ